MLLNSALGKNTYPAQICFESETPDAIRPSKTTLSFVIEVRPCRLDIGFGSPICLAPETHARDPEKGLAFSSARHFLYWIVDGFRKGVVEMVEVIALVVFVVAVSFWWFQAARQKKRQATLASRRHARISYHCVEVRAGDFTCGAAEKLEHVRYLSDEAPSLPVPGCRVERCTCSYIHHDDRRDDDRRNPYGHWSNVPPAIAGERRSRTERRQSRGNTFRPSIAR